MPVDFDAQISPYEYSGDIPALGSLQMTMMAKSFESVESTDLGDLFPDTNINERSIVIEQVIEGLGIMPIVRFGVPGGGFVEPDRVRSMRVNPAVVREEDSIDQALINQLRKVGTVNTAWNPADIIAQRIQKLVVRHKRTKDLFRAKTLLGGISYLDPRTNVSINVSTNIPVHNLISYKGWNTTLASGGTANIGGQNYTSDISLVNDKGRTEAAFFTSTDGKFAVPFTHPKADIVRALVLIKQFLKLTNKNVFTDVIMSSDLLTVIQSVNEYLKAFYGMPSVLSSGSSPATPNLVTMSGSEITHIAGLRIRTIDGMYRDPVDNQIKTYWPAHKIAIVAARSSSDASATLGYTQHCVGEAPDGQPGVYMRSSGDLAPPSPAGRVIQMGDSFLPFAVYPHWICLVDVCDPNELSGKLILQSNLNYGTF